MSRSGWPLPRAKDAVECMMSVAFQFGCDADDGDGDRWR